MAFDLAPFLTTTAIAGMAIAATSWLARTVMVHWLDGRLDAHKVAIERQNEVELERLKAQLQVAAAAQEAKFTRLHERQAEVISEVFARLERMHLAFRRWVAITRPIDASIKNQAREASDAYNKFVDYYYENAIWLDGNTTRVVNSIIEDLWAVSVDMTFDVNENGFPRDRKALRTAHKRVTERIPAVRNVLDDQLRRILGVVPEGLVLPALPPTEGEDAG
jgi:hypothetical protein